MTCRFGVHIQTQPGIRPLIGTAPTASTRSAGLVECSLFSDSCHEAFPEFLPSLPFCPRTALNVGKNQAQSIPSLCFFSYYPGMFKKLFVASVATTLIATASPALAQDTIPVAESPNPITTLEGPLKKDQPRGALSDGEIAGIVLGVIGAVTLIGGGAVWAVQQGFIPNPLPGILPSPAPAPAPLPAPAPEPVAPAPAPIAEPAPAPAPRPAAAPRPATKTYPNCRAVWRDLGRSIRRSDAGYDTHLDRDGDGIGCERRPR